VDTHQIRYFLAVVDHQGVNAAATALELAQPTLSRAIRELERELRIELFHRIGRGMVLTSAGHSFVGPARKILRDLVAAEGVLPDASGQLRGRLDLSSGAGLIVEPVARLVGAFRQRHPKVVVRIGDLLDAEAAAAMIKDGHCEIVFCHLPASGTEGLVTRVLGVQEFWVAYPPGTELPPDDPLPLSALPDIPLVIVPRVGSYTIGIERSMTLAGRIRRPAAIVPRREARVPFVMAGVGGTFVDRSAALEGAARGLVVRATDPAFSLDHGYVYDDASLSPAGRAFVELLGSLEPAEARAEVPAEPSAEVPPAP
jgi:DNA-binding transcriptional LysR family regulator